MMVKRWLVYLIAWIGCLVFFICYQEWFSWVTLVAVSGLPWFSLLMSLPAMLTCRLCIQVPKAWEAGVKVPLNILCLGPLPAPAWRVDVRVERLLTRQYWVLKPGNWLPTDHCGCLRILPGKAWIYDYLGLFQIPMAKLPQTSVTVRPVAVELPADSASNPNRILRWVPKRGGGFAENYELRLYRPGDSIQQIHWKLSGKTGKLILREPMVPATPPTLALVLSGTPAVLDRKLGQLLSLGRDFLSKSIPFQILVATGNGIFRARVNTESDLNLAVDALLSRLPAADGTPPPRGQRCIVIGGGQHET